MQQSPSNESQADYPAAHSMDTTWFALDKDGHVAVFESFEGGTVPNDALSDQSGSTDPVESIAAHAHQSEAIYVFDDQRSPLRAEHPHVMPSRRRRHQPIGPSTNWMQRIASMFKRGSASAPTGNAPAANDPNDFEEIFYGPVVMMVADPQAFAPFIDQGVCQRLRTTNIDLVGFKTLPVDVYHSIHHRGACAGCFYAFSFEEDEDSGRPAFSKIGLYHYACCEDQASVPYGRVAIPSRPLDVEQLPAQLQDALAKVQFTDLTFADTPYIQPAARTPCSSWDGGYLREDWKTYQANPGQEKEYKEMYEQFKEEGYMDGVTFLPPDAK